MKGKSIIEDLYQQFFIKSCKNESDIEFLSKQLQQLLQFEKNEVKLSQKASQLQLDLVSFSQSLCLDTCCFVNNDNIPKISELFPDKWPLIQQYIKKHHQQNQQLLEINLDSARTEISSLEDSDVQKISVSCQTDVSSAELPTLSSRAGQKNEQKLEKTPFQLGVLINLHRDQLLDHGFKKIYDQPYSVPFTEDMLQRLQYDCPNNTLICIGGVKITAKQQLIVCAIDYAQELYMLTSESLKSRRSSSAEIYWYHFANRCFGFSKHPKISASQYTVDESDILSEFRFCMWLDGEGGYRVGNLKNLKNSSEYCLVIYKQY